MIHARGARHSYHDTRHPRHHRLPLHPGIFRFGTGRFPDIEPVEPAKGAGPVEGGGMNVSHAGERGDADGFGGYHRIPGIGIGPDRGYGEAFALIHPGSGGYGDVYDLRDERGPDEDAGHGVFGGREQGCRDRDGSGGSGIGIGLGGRFELLFEGSRVEGGRLGDSAFQYRREREPAGAGAL